MISKAKDAIAVKLKKREKDKDKEVGDKAYAIASSDTAEEQKLLNKVNARHLERREKLLAKKEKLLERKERQLKSREEVLKMRKSNARMSREEYDSFDVFSSFDSFNSFSSFYSFDPITFGYVDDPFMKKTNDKRKRWFDDFDFDFSL